MAGGRDVNEKCCAKVFGGWKSPTRDFDLLVAAQIEQRLSSRKMPGEASGPLFRSE
jgi:hypothetical protein